MRLLELFSGYGTASFALKRLGVEYECVGYSDIDKYANHCFQQNHGGKELGDVTKIDEKTLLDFDLLTGGFPCQAFSVAGKGLGELDPRGTLFNEIIRIAEHKKPKYMLLENVKGLTSKKFKDTFDKILSELDRIGYDVYWEVLNTKDYGIPQSRARVWFVCFRKDLNRTEFTFPEKEELKIFIKDILEPVVDTKYYLSEKLQERFAEYLDEKNRKLSQSEPAILDLYNKKVKDNLVYDNIIKSIQLDISGKGYKSQQDRVYQDIGIMSCLPNANPTNKVNVFIANCLDANMHKGIDPVGFYDKSKRNVVRTGQLRRLTPKECFRLQGFLNDEVNLEGLSDTQRYKLAGNGQSVNVVEKIFREMFTGYQKEMEKQHK